MAVDKLVDSTQLDSNLTSVANAIRAKSGGSSQLAFPAGFVSEIGNIPSGGDYTADDFADRNKPTGTITITSDTNLAQYLLYARKGITEAIIFNVTNIPDNFFGECSALRKVTAPDVTTLSAGAFNGAGLEYAVFPKATTVYSNAIRRDSYLLGIDFGGSPTSSQGLCRNNGISECSNVKTLVLRGSTVWPLTSVSVFTNTPFASGKSGGTLYVPSSLISSYQNASNWSTLLGYTNNQIKSIESTHTDPDAPIDLTLYYVDGTLIPTA